MAAAHENDSLTEQIIGFAIEVRRHLGPGLLESVYEECLCYELAQDRTAFRRQVPLPVVYKAVRLDCGYRMNVVVDGRVILKVKTVEHLVPIHQAQLLTYMKLSGIPTGLLLNFHSAALKDGIRGLML
jgi:GxxExxY protein